MLKEYYLSLSKAMKWTILVVFLGVVVNGTLALVSRYELNNATEMEREADRLRVLGDVSLKEASKLKDYADKLSLDLQSANAKIDKLQSAVDKIKVPPPPGPAPENKNQLIADLKGMGLGLVVKPSTTISPSLVGITEADGRSIWGWGKQNLRIPSLEQKIDGYANLVVGLQSARDLAITLSESRSLQADAAVKAADLYKQEADMQREVSTSVKRALASEKKRRYLYAAGAAALTYAVTKH